MDDEVFFIAARKDIRAATSGMREIVRFAYPREVSSIKVGGKLLSNNVVDAIWGFLRSASSVR